MIIPEVSSSNFHNREMWDKIVDYSISDEDGNESDLDEESPQEGEEGMDKVAKGTEESIETNLQDSGLVGVEDGNLGTESHSDGKASAESGDVYIKPEHENQDEISSSSLVENDELEAAFLDIDYEEESEDEDSKDDLETVSLDVVAEPVENVDG